MDKSSLEQLLFTYNRWMGVSTVAVAIGILGEYVAHFVFEKEARRNKLEMAISVLFGVLVLGGVVGEYIFGSKLSEVTGTLQRIADTEVARSNKEAESAHREAEIARKEAASLADDIAKEEKGVADANARAALAEQHAAEANKKAEDERIARLKLEAALAPRRVSSEQERLITSRLLKFKKWQITLFVVTGNPEAADFASDFERVFRNAGFSVNVMDGVISGPARGLSAATGKGRLADIEVLAKALKAAGLITQPLPVERNDEQPEFLELIVAPK